MDTAGTEAVNVLSLIAGIFQPAATLLDELHTSVEEKAQIELALKTAQLHAAVQFMDYEKQLLQGKTSIVVAEARGGSWLQRSWRPITMLVFLALVVCDSFGFLPFRLADEAWTLLQLGLSGYVVGRSVEKSLPHMRGIFNNGG